MLSVTRLQLLREVARRGTIASAAAAVHLTPSAVSQQLSTLEQEVEVELLVPVGRSVRLTDAGHMLVLHADRIMGDIAAAETELISMRGVVTGEFGFAAFQTAARTVMPSTIATLGQLFPAVRFSLRDLQPPDEFSALRIGDIDLAVVDDYEGMALMGEFNFERHHVMSDPIFLALPPNLTRTEGPVALSDFRDSHWIMDTEHGRFCEMVLRACRMSGFEPRIRCHCNDFSTLVALVEAGMGVAAVPGLAVYDRPVRADIRPVRPSLARDIVATTRSDQRNHPVVGAAISELKRFGRAYDAARTKPPLSPLPGNSDG